MLSSVLDFPQKETGVLGRMPHFRNAPYGAYVTRLILHHR